MTNQPQQQQQPAVMASTYGNSTVNSSTTTINQANSNSNNGLSTPTSNPTMQSRPQSLSDKKTIDASIEDGIHYPPGNKDERRGSDLNSEEPLSRRGSMSDDDGVVMEGGYRGYLVVFGGFLVTLIGYVSIYGVFQAKYNDIYGARGSTQSSISFVGSLASGFQFGFTIIAGPAMNRFGHKITLWAGCIIASLGLLLASWCTELWQLYLTQGVMFGIGASFLNIAATAIPPLWYDKNRGLAMGICFCGAGVGGLGLGFAIPALINAVDIYWTLRIFAIFHFVCTAFAAIVMRAPRQLAGPPVEAKREVMNWSLMKDYGFMLWFLCSCLFGFAYVVPFAYVPSFAKDVIGLDPNVQGGQLLAIMSGANAVGRIIIGIAGDRLGAIPIAGVSFIGTGASCFIWMFSKTHGALIAFSIVYGFFSGAFFTMIASITANIVGLADLGSGLTIIYLINTPGNLFTLPIAGKIFEQAGNYKAMIGYDAAMWFAGGLVLFAMMAYHHHTQQRLVK
ncbi:MAG: major facilitator superfamily domain-containing protein [Linnemannia elongata]|nr:MAG: major facilitator superfamily domain-containing protein [Linnemannia elongata]